MRNTALVRLHWRHDSGVWAHRPTARYVYSCDECGFPIKIGATYYSLATLMVIRLCDECGASRLMEPESRTTLFTLHWDDDVSLEDILRHSRAWAAGLSEAAEIVDEVRMQTFGTVV